MHFDLNDLLHFLFVPLILWLIFHYVTVWKQQKRAARIEEGALADMWTLAHRLEQRVATLEKLLDAEAPGWRGRSS